MDQKRDRDEGAAVAYDRVYLTVGAQSEPLFAPGRYSRHRNCPLHVDDPARLGNRGEDDNIKLIAKYGLASRACSAIDPIGERGVVPLDPIAEGITRMRPGGRIY